MPAIASSRINKSGKKFAPKAPARRAATGQTKQTVENALDETDASDQPATTLTGNELPPPTATQEQVQVAVNTLRAEANAHINVQSIKAPQQIEDDAVAIPIPAPAPPSTSQTTIPVIRATRHVAEPAKLTLAAAEIPQESITNDEQSAATTSVNGIAQNRGSKRKATATTVDTSTNKSNSKRQKVNVRKAIEKDKGHSADNAEPSVSPDASNRLTRRQKASRSTPKAVENGSADPKQVPKRATRKTQSKKSLEDVASEIVAEATGEGKNQTKPGRKRQATPEEAEAHMVTTSTVRMADLTKDSRLGKKSQRETMLQNTNWDEVKKKRKELEEARLAKDPKDTRVDQVIQPAGPKMVIINGNITAQVGSEFVDTTNGAFDEQNEVAPINEDDIVKRVTTATLGRKRKSLGPGKWNEDMTALFYRGLRMHGTNFEFISRMFPGLSRSNIKSKFVKEERANAELIKQTLLGPREKFDIEEFSRLTNTVYKDVNDFNKELQEESKKVEADIAREEAERNKQADASTVQGEDDAVRDDKEGKVSAKENRFSAIAESIVIDATGGGKKGKRRPLSKKNLMKDKHLAGGEARILGPVDES